MATVQTDTRLRTRVRQVDNEACSDVVSIDAGDDNRVSRRPKWNRPHKRLETGDGKGSPKFVPASVETPNGMKTLGAARGTSRFKYSARAGSFPGKCRVA